MVVLQQFFLFLRSLFAQYVNLCAHLETQCLFIDWKLTFVASRIQSDWLPSYLPIIVSIEIVCFCIVGLAVWRMVNRILRLVPPDPLVYVMPQFHVVRTSGISQTRLHSAPRTNAATSHFKLNQVIETWVTSSIPYTCPPVAGLQDWATSPYDCVGGGTRTRDAEHVKLWHYTWVNLP